MVKNQVTKKKVGIDSQDAIATDNETTESGKAATNDVSDKSDHEFATTNKSDAGGNNKRAADENLLDKKGKKVKRALERNNDGVQYRIITRKRERNIFIENIQSMIILIYKIEID